MKLAIPVIIVAVAAVLGLWFDTLSNKREGVLDYVFSIYGMVVLGIGFAWLTYGLIE
ncbi:MAG: hypothetical protein MN733_05085 [Nitrososphaera sp.]|nr:hypothetical protein [Nitrososphaera sp.]